MPTEQEYQVIQRAHGMITQECMAEKGFDWEPTQPYSAERLFHTMDRRYRYVDDRANAAKYGYHLIPGPPRDDDDREYTEEELIALFGDDEDAFEPGGCTGEAIDHMAGGLEHPRLGGIMVPDVVAEINRLSYVRSQEHPRVQEALEHWSACMAERGYEIDDPINYLPPEFDIESPKPSKEEITMALWDVGCQQRTGLLVTWLSVESRIQENLIEQRADTFAQVETEHEELVRRATEVVEGHSR